MHESEEREEKLLTLDSWQQNASLTENVGNGNLTDSFLRRPYNVILEENLRLRQAINDVVLTNQRWLRYNQEQAAHVRLLLQSLEDAESEKKKIAQELEAMKLQVKAYQEDWEHENREKLQATKEKNKARDLIAKLQEENWQLRTTHTVREFTTYNDLLNQPYGLRNEDHSKHGILISRGTSGSSDSSTETIHRK